MKRGVLDSASNNDRSQPETSRNNVQSSERLKNYKSKFYLEQVEGDRELKVQREREKESKKRMAEKANNYAKYVREMYAPQVSGAETADTKENNYALQEPEVISIINPRRPLREQNKKHGLRRNTTAENKYNNIRISVPDNASSLAERQQSSLDSKPSPQYRSKFDSTSDQGVRRSHAVSTKHDVTKESGKPPVKDYLREMKSKREQQHPQRQMYGAEIDKVLRSQEMTEAEKYKLVRMRTEQLEQRAEQEERVLQVLGGEGEVDRAIEVNDMYIESIKAKLKMLD